MGNLYHGKLLNNQRVIRKNILVYGLFGESNSVFLPGIQFL